MGKARRQVELGPLDVIERDAVPPAEGGRVGPQINADVEDLATTCHFSDCTHDGEPGCAVALAVTAGELSQDRVDAYGELRREAASAARRANEHERRTYERKFTKAVKAHVKGKPNNQP